MDTTLQPRRRIAVFLVLTFASSAIFWGLLIAGGGLEAPGGQLLVLGLMWSPGVAAMATQLATRRSLRGLGWEWGWRRGATRYQVVAYLLPLAYALSVYVPVWLLGLGGLDHEVLHRAAERFGLGAVAGSWLGVGVIAPLLPIVGLLGLVPNAVFALGEEIGWRGFLVPELRRVTSFTGTALSSGLIWALWHMPVILFAGYHAEAPLWYAIVCFTVLAVGMSFALAWLRLRSGSLWTATLLHASHNLFVQSFFDRLTTDTGPTAWLTGEFGAGLALAAVVVAYLFWRRRGVLAGDGGAGGGTDFETESDTELAT